MHVVRVLHTKLFREMMRDADCDYVRVGDDVDGCMRYRIDNADVIKSLKNKHIIEIDDHLASEGEIEFEIAKPNEFDKSYGEALDDGLVFSDDVRIVDGGTCRAPAHEWLRSSAGRKEIKIVSDPEAAPETSAAALADMNSTDWLIELGKQDTIFFHTPDDTCYAAVKLETGGYAIYPLNEKSRQFKKILKHRYYNATGKAPAAEPLKAAIGVLESIAAYEGDTIELHNRVAWHGDSIVYDLTNSNYEAIEITPQGWGLMPHGHIIFRRFSHQTPQVYPIPGGNPWRLFEFRNVSKSDRLINMVYLISCLVPDIPHPIPIKTGEHGSTKTTGSRMEKSLIDPSDMDVISLQPNEERMMLLLHQHWFVMFDNVTYLQQWQSDALCRASTGEGTMKRTFYTDEDVTIFKYKRCVGLNGINNAATKPDLLDRAVFLNLEPIPKDRRIEERILFERFNEAKPEILGGMFDVLSKALRIYPTIKLKEKPRMADFAVWGCAIAEALGRTKEEFLEAYYANIGRINREALAESMIGNLILTFMEDLPEWEGTPTQLHNELEMLAPAHGIDIRSRTWVKTPRSLGKRLRLIIPNLREEGITVEMRRTSAGQVYRITNTFSSETKTTQTTQTTRHSVFGANSKLHQTTQTTSQTTPADEDVVSQTTLNDETTPKLHAQKQQQEAAECSDVVCVVSATNRRRGDTCGKCGCELTGQTFQGPAGLGLICADCQAELDKRHGLGGSSDDRALSLIRSAIYRLGYVRSIHEFTPIQVLMELPKGTSMKAETVEQFMIDHAADLKIERMGGGRWRQVIG